MFRVNDFGVINEARKKQIHYLFTEAETIEEDNKKNHGPNAVISMLHSYLCNEQHGEVLHLHCDNCCGQNKNKSVMAYFCWRVMAGLEKCITVSFMVVGHTRCSVDGGFGLAKKAYRQADCSTIQDLAEVITSSSLENDVSCADWYWRDWDSFLQLRFKKIVGITAYHHFTFSSENPGCVVMKKTVDDEEPVLIQLSREPPIDLLDDQILPDVLPPAGVSKARAKYLYTNVSPFSSPLKRDDFLKMFMDI